MKKVYCKNCKWKGQRQWFWNSGAYVCKKQSWFEILGSGEKKWHYSYCINKDFDCKFYQPKLWRKLLKLN